MVYSALLTNLLSKVSGLGKVKHCSYIIRFRAFLLKLRQLAKVLLSSVICVLLEYAPFSICQEMSREINKMTQGCYSLFVFEARPCWLQWISNCQMSTENTSWRSILCHKDSKVYTSRWECLYQNLGRQEMFKQVRGKERPEEVRFENQTAKPY